MANNSNNTKIALRYSYPARPDIESDKERCGLEAQEMAVSEANLPPP